MDIWLQLLVSAFTAGAVYGAIKGDLMLAHAKADAAKKSADEAHQRIDRMMEHEHELRSR